MALLVATGDDGARRVELARDWATRGHVSQQGLSNAVLADPESVVWWLYHFHRQQQPVPFAGTALRYRLDDVHDSLCVD